ncbi:MAG: hypothetical protein Q9208_004651 [Pyrenodesmia sp. 3 TL-2023]
MGASSSFCPDCFYDLRSTATYAMQAASQDVTVPHNYDNSRQQPHRAATPFPAASTSSQLFKSVDNLAPSAIRTTNFVHPLLHFRLSKTGSESTLAQTLTAAQISSCYLGSQNIGEHGDALLSNPRFDEILDGSARPVHCHRSCSLLYLLAHPEINTVIHDVSRLLDLPGLICDFLGQLYRKVKTHWGALFDSLRSWLSGRRNKTSFSRQKAAIATALAQLLTCVELYNAAVAKWSSMGMPMVNLATGIATLSSYLEFLGKGVESKSFDVERKKTWTNKLAMQLCTGSPDAPAASTILMLPPSPEDAHDFIFNRVPNFDVARAWEEQATAQCLDLQRRVEEEQGSIRKIEGTLQEKHQNVRNLLQEVHEIKISLGLMKPPGPNIFDDHWPSPIPVSEEQSDSPGAMTLVGSGLEVPVSSPIKEKSPDRFPAPIIDFGSNDAEDVLLKELTTDIMDQSIDQTFVDIRKRKRFSKHIASKKVRIEENGRPDGMTCAPSAGVRTQKYDKPQIIHTSDKTTHENVVNDDANFPVTSRPISWPRTSSRLFRYSAGVSVKKLTDVFENLGLKQRQP